MQVEGLVGWKCSQWVSFGKRRKLQNRFKISRSRTCRAPQRTCPHNCQGTGAPCASVLPSKEGHVSLFSGQNNIPLCQQIVLQTISKSNFQIHTFKVARWLRTGSSQASATAAPSQYLCQIQERLRKSLRKSLKKNQENWHFRAQSFSSDYWEGAPYKLCPPSARTADGQPCSGSKRVDNSKTWDTKWYKRQRKFLT